MQHKHQHGPNKDSLAQQGRGFASIAAGEAGTRLLGTLPSHVHAALTMLGSSPLGVAGTLDLCKQQAPGVSCY